MDDNYGFLTHSSKKLMLNCTKTRWTQPSDCGGWQTVIPGNVEL